MKNHIFSEEHKKHLRKPKAKDCKKRLSEYRKGKRRGPYIKHKPNILCIYCKKEISANMYVRWHGEKCKCK